MTDAACGQWRLGSERYHKDKNGTKNFTRIGLMRNLQFNDDRFQR